MTYAAKRRSGAWPCLPNMPETRYEHKRDHQTAAPVRASLLARLRLHRRQSPGATGAEGRVERALSDEEGISLADAFTADGEGYSLYVVLNVSEDLSSPDWQGLRLPYTDPIAKQDALSVYFGPEALVYPACDVCAAPTQPLDSRFRVVCGAPVCSGHHAQHAQGCAKCADAKRKEGI